MTEIRVHKFNPHPAQVADNFSPVTRPSLAFNMTDQFRSEMHVILLCMCSARSTTFENIIHYARQKYLENDVNDDLTQVVLYQLIHQEYAYEGNADGMWTDTEKYMPLLKYPAIQIAMDWLVSAMFRQSNHFLQNNDSDLMNLERRTDLSFLFERANVSMISSKDDPNSQDSLVGQVAGLSQQMASMTEVMERTIQRLEGISGQSEDSRAESGSSYVSPNTDTLIDPTYMSLEQLVRKAFEITNQGAPVPSLSYSSLWTAPPPVSLTTFYSMKDMSPTSRTFLIDAFLDLYNSQMCMLSIHFYLRRMAALWQRGGDTIENALFSKEMFFLKSTISSFVEKITNQFSLKFLAMEGISLTGAKNIEILDSIFPAPGARGGIKPVIDIEKYLESVIDTIRDCCVGLDRLRVSFLYGEKHPSYVGDNFIASYLYRNYITRHASCALETIMAVTPTLANMTLPGDQKRNIEFYNDLFGHTIDSANDRFVLEPDMRHHFDEKVLDLMDSGKSSGKSRHMPTEGELKSLFPATPEGDLLLDLVKKMWSDPAVMLTRVHDEDTSTS